MTRILSRLKGRKMLAKGKRGVVYTALLGKKKVAIKEKRIESTAEGNIEREAGWLKILNGHGIGPKLVGFENGCLVYEFVEGEYLRDFISQGKAKSVLKVLEDVMLQCRKMDELGINKMEMTRPRKHVIVPAKAAGKGKGIAPVMIDFERCRRSDRPKNVTQFCQYLTLAENSKMLSEKGISIGKAEVIKAARAYKEKQSDKNFRDILALLG